MENNLQFQEVDDLSNILPFYKDALSNKDEKIRILKLFDLFLTNKFKEDDLCFALLEFTHNFNFTQTGEIGDVVILSNKNVFKKKIEDYQEIVKKVKKKFQNNPLSSFKDWYYRNTYILLKNNKTDKVSTAGNECFIERNVSKIKCGQHMRPLTKDHTEKYLNFYAQLMHSDFGLKNYPHYCIIIRPISILNDSTNEIFPIGNLYLHFASNLTKDKDVDFYKKLINDFLILWTRVNNFKILESVYVPEQVKQRPPQDFYPYFGDTSISPEKQTKIFDFYDQIFLDPKKRIQFEREIKLFLENTIDILYNNNCNDNFLNKLYGAGMSNEKMNLEKFCVILKQREFVKIGFLLFNKSIQYLNYVLTKSSLPPTIYKDKDLNKSHYGYFNERFLPIKEKETLETSKISIISTFSKFEKKWYNQIGNIIPSKYSKLEESYKKFVRDINK